MRVYWFSLETELKLPVIRVFPISSNDAGAALFFFLSLTTLGNSVV